MSILYRVTLTAVSLHHTQVLTDPACVDPNKEAKRKKQKTSMSMGTFLLCSLCNISMSLAWNYLPSTR